MEYYVGWDVGAWNCSRKSKSQDAIAVLKEQGERLVLCGKETPWVFRGPLRDEIATVKSVASLIEGTCGVTVKEEDVVTVAIDTPLGLPVGVQSLVKQEPLPDSVPKSYLGNPYLYRQTEQWVARHEFPPLSAIKDMIGSQCTKGLHLLQTLKMTVNEGCCGVWKSGQVTVIECYPATCKRSETKGYICQGSPFVQGLFSAVEGTAGLAVVDQVDAVYCALVAYLFARRRDKLLGPQKNPPPSEGWIWYPTDAVGRKSRKKKLA